MSSLANLKAELARKGFVELNYTKLAADMNIDLRTIKSRMDGSTDFSSEEMLKIRNLLGTDDNGKKFTIEYLFFDNFTNEHSQEVI